MIRRTRPDDVEAIIALIRELAVYEKLEDQMAASPAELHEALFGDPPACEGLVATDGAVLGYASFFPIYSTFKTKRCLYLEDLYVTPEARGRGLGKALLANVARIAVERGCPRLDWSVLSWNEPAIAFYSGLGASVSSDWWLCRAEGDALPRIAAGADMLS